MTKRRTFFVRCYGPKESFNGEHARALVIYCEKINAHTWIGEILKSSNETPFDLKEKRGYLKIAKSIVNILDILSIKVEIWVDGEMGPIPFVDQRFSTRRAAGTVMIGDRRRWGRREEDAS